MLQRPPENRQGRMGGGEEPRSQRRQLTEFPGMKGKPTGSTGTIAIEGKIGKETCAGGEACWAQKECFNARESCSLAGRKEETVTQVESAP